MVPRSGSITITAANAQTTSPTGFISSAMVFGGGRRARTAQTQTHTASFASSAGWKLTGPTMNQRCAPLIAGPRTSTAAQATKAPTSRIGARGRNAW